ncbi:MAG: hypothetical protein GY839_08095 [candidate division Zixibacteria bacterium]|nr:hypothetical protein [candidate division Zixibacteria bacterium]
MAAGGWPPAFIGGDVTYLSYFFRGLTDPCNLEGFWASADANGDCLVIGNDVTKMVAVMRGIGSILYCPDYEPAWPTSGDVPPVAPEGWPNCDPPALNNTKVMPSSKSQ